MATIVALLIIPFYFNYISKEEFGVWLTVNAVIALITMVELGVDQYLTTRVSVNSLFYSEKIRDELASVLVVKAIIVLLFCLIGFFLYAFFTSLITIDAHYLKEAKVAFLFATAFLASGVFLSTIPTILSARRHFVLVNGLAAASSIVVSFSTLALLANGFGIKSFPLALLVVALIQNAILIIFLRNKYPHIRITLRSFTFVNNRGLINYSTSYQIIRFVHTLRTQYINIAINNLIGPAAVTIYNMTNRLPALIPGYAGKAVAPLFPIFAEYFAEEKAVFVKNLFLRITKVLFRLSIFAGIVVYFLNPGFISIWVGSENFAEYGTLLWLVIYMIVYSALGACGIVIFSSKRFENWTAWSIIEIATAIGLSYLLSFNFGLTGIVGGFVIASMINQFYVFRVVLRQLDIRFVMFLRAMGAYVVVPNVITAVFGIALFKVYEIHQWIDLGIACFFFCVVHFGFYEGIQIANSSEQGLKAKILAVIKV